MNDGMYVQLSVVIRSSGEDLMVLSGVKLPW